MIYSQEKDEILVSMTLLGNQQAYEALVIRWQKAVLSVARGITHSEHLAEDAAQDAFVSAWLKLNTLRDGSKYGTWVCNIARNRSRDLLSRFREWVDIDYIAAIEDKEDVFFAELADCGDEATELHDNLNSLSEKVRKVIDLHYFGGYSIAEIAEMLSIPQNTVKTRLSQGRQKLRKEYGLMNEKDINTLAEKVLKNIDELKAKIHKNIVEQIEELKTVFTRSTKDEFFPLWKELMEEVEALPESSSKNQAMAKALFFSYWWSNGEEKHNILQRIKECSIRARDEEMLITVINLELPTLPPTQQSKHITELLIPQMEDAGLTQTVGFLYYLLGRNCDTDTAESALRKAMEILPPTNVYHAVSSGLLALYNYNNAEYAHLRSEGSTYMLEDSALKRISCVANNRGYRKAHPISIAMSTSFSGTAYDTSLKKGEQMTIGTLTLINEDDDATVTVPCGTFHGCSVWTVKFEDELRARSYYKDGVGLLKTEASDMINNENVNVTHVLTDYKILGGEGLMPAHTGNYWKYDVSDCKIKYNGYEVQRQVVGTSNDGTVCMSETLVVKDVVFNSLDWKGMLNELLMTYGPGYTYTANNITITEVADQLVKLAVTPYERAYSTLAASVLRRITECNPTINPNTKTVSHWNYLDNYPVWIRENEILAAPAVPFMGHGHMGYDWTPGNWEARHVLFWNDIYGVIVEATTALWSDEWIPGAVIEKKSFVDKGMDGHSIITISDGGTVTTEAGVFDNCVRVHVEPSDNYPFHISYCKNIKDYYYAKGIGIVRTVHYYGQNNSLTGIYELTSYKGTGEGYFPVAPGMERVYEAVNMRDGYEAGVKYVYTEDEQGQLYIIGDRKGIRHLE